MSDSVNFNVTATTQEFDEALAKTATQTKEAFESMQNAAQESADMASASLAVLQAALTATVAEIEQYSNTTGEAAAQTVASYQAMAASIEEQIAALQSLGAAQEANTAQVAEATGTAEFNRMTSLQAIDAMMGWNRALYSASDSAAVFQNSLQELGMGEFESRIRSLGDGITNLSGAQFGELIETNRIAATSFMDAASSVETFEAALAELESDLGQFLGDMDAATASLGEFKMQMASLNGMVNNKDNWTQVTAQQLRDITNANAGVVSSFSRADLASSTFTKELDDLSDALSSVKVGQSGLGVGLTESQLQFARANGVLDEYGNKLNVVSTSYGNLTAHAHANTQVVREGMVEVDEFMRGQITRMPGSFMVLAERIGGLSAATLGWVGVLAIAGYAVVEFIRHLSGLDEAVDKAQAAMAAFNPGISVSQTQALVDNADRVSGVSGEMAGNVVADFARMHGATDPVIKAMSDNVNELSKVMGRSIPQAASMMADAYDAPKQSGIEFLNHINASTDSINKFNTALQDNDPIEARTILLQQMFRAANQASSRPGNSLALDSTFSERSDAALLGGSGDYEAQADAMQQMQALKTQYMSDDKAALADIGGAVATSKSQFESWGETQQAALAQINAHIVDNANNFRQASEEKTAADIKFWQGVISRGNLSSQQLAQAKTQLYNLEEEQGSRNLKIQTQNASDGLKAQLAAINAEEAANVGSVQEITSLENQKLQLLESAYGKDSAQYQQELARKVALTKEAARQMTDALRQSLADQQTLNNAAARDYLGGLQEEVSSQQITKSEMLQDYLEFIQQQQQGQLSTLDNLISTLNAGTVAYAAALRERAVLQAQFQKTDDQLQRSITATTEQESRKQQSAYTTMFASITRSGKEEINQLILDQTTWQGALLKIYGSMLTSFVGFAEQMLAKWSATMLASTLMTRVNVAQQVATQQAAGASGWGAMINGILQYMGVEKVAAVSSKATQTVSALSQIHAAAAVAAANAYAATAAIPVVGPGMAPAAAATAEVNVDAFAGAAALDVGAWNIPKDMPANIHQGEMVVPRTFADGLRAGGSLGGAATTSPVTVAPSFAPTINLGGSGDVSMQDLEYAMNNQFQQLVNYFNNMVRTGNLTLMGRI